MPKVGVLLSGCGVYDGSEVHEAVITLLALERAGADYVCMAPDVEQLHVIDHRTQQPVPGETRNVLRESARIARGEITALDQVDVDELDALVIPGGFGAAKNLCTFAIDGPACTVNPDVRRVVGELYDKGRPIAALCVAPTLLAKLFEGKEQVTLTIGNEKQFVDAIETMGSHHEECSVGNYVVDAEHKVLTTPAYMLGPGISDVAEGIEGLIQQLVAMVA